MTGLVGMDKRGRLHLLLDGLMSGRQHGADSSLCLIDCAATEAKTKVLFKLLLYLADALIKLPALQGDVTEQVRAHLVVTDCIRQRCLSHVDAVGTGGSEQLILGDEVAHLWRIKHLLHLIRFVMSQNLATTAGAIRCWVERLGHRADGVPAADHLWPGRWHAARPVTGGGFGRVTTVLV